MLPKTMKAKMDTARNVTLPPGRVLMNSTKVSAKPDCVSDQDIAPASAMIIMMVPESAIVSTRIAPIRRSEMPRMMMAPMIAA
jgi:hypothetical protein